ncbi:MAG: hypothetical protein EOP34_05760 [Rickettsiales bacterium]|nr:MAG: hypothetical protein EOP34_05760 [Rickettsiales bacterium]
MKQDNVYLPSKDPVLLQYLKDKYNHRYPEKTIFVRITKELAIPKVFLSNSITTVFKTLMSHKADIGIAKDIDLKPTIFTEALKAQAQEAISNPKDEGQTAAL